ncbi:hypothetical protein YO5_11045 [Stutzerimonas stutzeri TS44]|nr:hypothetical protein YO5_11045 [Stutzerimonas stutzeri TS44]
MHDDAADDREEAAEPAAIDFHSPGRFGVHNPLPDQPQPTPWQPAPARLGEDAGAQHFTSPEQVRAHALALFQQAQRNLCLYSPDLESWLFHHSSIQQACTRFLLAHPRNRLRILIEDSTRAVQSGHRLLTLARRLSSNAQIRKVNPEYPREEDIYLIADKTGLLIRPHRDPHNGYALYNDPARVRLSQSKFDQAWERSLPDANLRSFLL